MKDIRFPKGVWPVMLTPFTEEGKVDEKALRRLVDWYIEKGSDGLFAVCQSSEMFFLTDEEAEEIVHITTDQAAGRVHVIASGLTDESLEHQAEQVKRMYQAGAEAVILITNRFAKEEEDDNVWKQRVADLLERIPEEIPLGFYECPYPYKRMISLDNLEWAASTGRFYFLKDTCCDAELIRERIRRTEGSCLKIYNANTATLRETLGYGAAGYSGVMANFHPDLYKWLFEHYEDERAEALNDELTIAALIERQVYPVNAKYSLAAYEGVDMTSVSRTKKGVALNNTEITEVSALYRITQRLRKEYLG